jgi:hypothetical protein
MRIWLVEPPVSPVHVLAQLVELEVVLGGEERFTDRFSVLVPVISSTVNFSDRHFCGPIPGFPELSIRTYCEAPVFGAIADCWHSAARCPVFPHRKHKPEATDGLPVFEPEGAGVLARGGLPLLKLPDFSLIFMLVAA